MKVLCISDEIKTDFDKLPPLSVGEIYNVVKETKHQIWEFYMFSELNVNGYNCWYCKDNFIPLSSIDETEFERNYKTETQCQ